MWKLPQLNLQTQHIRAFVRHGAFLRLFGRLERMGPVLVSDFYGFPQLYPPGRVMCIFSTYRGRLRLALLFDRNAFPEGIQAGFLDPFLNHLGALVDGILRNSQPQPTVEAAATLLGSPANDIQELRGDRTGPSEESSLTTPAVPVYAAKLLMDQP